MFVTGAGQALELTPEPFKSLSETMWWLCFLTALQRDTAGLLCQVSARLISIYPH